MNSFFPLKLQELSISDSKCHGSQYTERKVALGLHTILMKVGLNVSGIQFPVKGRLCGDCAQFLEKGGWGCMQPSLKWRFHRGCTQSLHGGLYELCTSPCNGVLHNSIWNLLHETPLKIYLLKLIQTKPTQSGLCAVSISEVCIHIPLHPLWNGECTQLSGSVGDQFQNKLLS